MDDNFYNSFLPPSVRVCGRTLNRFTIWHHFLLSAIDSPLVSLNGLIFPKDLLVAVRLCQLPHGRHLVKPGLRDMLWKWRMHRNPRLFERHVAAFSQWMNLQCSPPRYWRKGRGSREYVDDKSPRGLALVCSLMHSASIPRDEAWNMTIGEARWTEAMLARCAGADIRFLRLTDIDDSPIDLSTLTDEEARAKFERDLPPTIAKATFEHWRENIKREKSPC